MPKYRVIIENIPRADIAQDLVELNEHAMRTVAMHQAGVVVRAEAMPEEGE